MIKSLKILGLDTVSSRVAFACSSATHCIHAIVAVTMVGAILADLELLSISAALKEGGGLRWKFQRVKRFTPRSKASWILRSALAYPIVVVMIVLRLFSAVACVLCLGFHCTITGSLACYVLISHFVNLRPRLGNNGSDKMFTVASSACLLASASGTVYASSGVILFLAAQLSAAYLTSSVAKMGQKKWWNGVFLTNLMSTRTFGVATLQPLLTRNLVLASWISRLLIIGECCGGLSPWTSPGITVYLLIGACVFHIAVAVIMGLNTFLFAYLALFPAAIYTSRCLVRPLVDHLLSRFVLILHR